MNELRIQVRLTILVGAHLLLGAVMAVVTICVKNWSEMQSVWYVSLVGSEILLLALWIGLSNSLSSVRSFGLVAGTMWLVLLACAPAVGTGRSAKHTLDMFLLVSVPVMALTICAAFCKRFWFAIEQRDDWSDRSVPQELQFSLKTLWA
jgi:hypothetical protein